MRGEQLGRLLMALSMYIGLGSFFAVNAVALLRGASVMTAMTRGLFALAIFAVLGVVASAVLRVRPHTSAEGQQKE